MKRWLFCLCLCLCLRGFALAESVTVYAAASLTSALQDLNRQAPVPLRLSFGSSSTLAKQIAQGAPVDIYISANASWMDFLSDDGMLEPETRVHLLGNALVMIAPKGEGFDVVPKSGFDFAKAFRGRLALGDPSHVPAGMYAKAALTRLGWWHTLKGRVAPTGDVRGALALVARGECAVGIVYATDAAADKQVDVIATLPDSLLQKPVVYPLAVVKGRLTPRVESVLRFLESEVAGAVFQQYGFKVLSVSHKQD